MKEETLSISEAAVDTASTTAASLLTLGVETQKTRDVIATIYKDFGVNEGETKKSKNNDLVFMVVESAKNELKRGGTTGDAIRSSSQAMEKHGMKSPKSDSKSPNACPVFTGSLCSKASNYTKDYDEEENETNVPDLCEISESTNTMSEYKMDWIVSRSIISARAIIQHDISINIAEYVVSLLLTRGRKHILKEKGIYLSKSQLIASRAQIDSAAKIIVSSIASLQMNDGSIIELASALFSASPSTSYNGKLICKEEDEDDEEFTSFLSEREEQFSVSMYTSSATTRSSSWLENGEDSLNSGTLTQSLSTIQYSADETIKTHEKNTLELEYEDENQVAHVFKAVESDSYSYAESALNSDRDCATSVFQNSPTLYELLEQLYDKYFDKKSNSNERVVITDEKSIAQVKSLMYQQSLSARQESQQCIGKSMSTEDVISYSPSAAPSLVNAIAVNRRRKHKKNSRNPDGSIETLDNGQKQTIVLMKRPHATKTNELSAIEAIVDNVNQIIVLAASEAVVVNNKTTTPENNNGKWKSRSYHSHNIPPIKMQIKKSVSNNISKAVKQTKPVVSAVSKAVKNTKEEIVNRSSPSVAHISKAMKNKKDEIVHRSLSFTPMVSTPAIAAVAASNISKMARSTKNEIFQRSAEILERSRSLTDLVTPRSSTSISSQPRQRQSPRKIKPEIVIEEEILYHDASYTSSPTSVLSNLIHSNTNNASSKKKTKLLIIDLGDFFEIETLLKEQKAPLNSTSSSSTANKVMFGSSNNDSSFVDLCSV